MNTSLKWFRGLTWLGIAINLAFALPALFAPDVLGGIFGIYVVEFAYVWLANAGMLLVQASLFYIPAANNPEKYSTYAWLSAASRLMASAFWVWQKVRWGLTGPLGNFYIVDGVLGIVFLVLLYRGFGGLSCRGEAEVPARNGALKGFGVVMWLGILVNLGFALPALFAPRWLGAYLHVTIISFTYVWLANAGLLLVQACLFYIPAARNPVRYVTYAWLSVFVRLMAALFWIWQVVQWHPTGPVRTFFVADAAFGILQAVLLQKGLPDNYKCTALNAARFVTHIWECITALFRTGLLRVVTPVVALLVVLLGYGLWLNLARVYPDKVYADPIDHFKYAPIGLSVESRIPYYLWQVLPDLFPERLPGGWASLGFIYEKGHDVPIGMAKRRIGYPSVEPNCALCHTGSYQTAPGAPVQVALGAPAHELDLQRFQWTLYDCASDPKFTPARVVDAIGKRFKLTMFQTLVYRYLIVPTAVRSLKQQAAAYAWQKTRPIQGRGRTDTFNPTKFNVFQMPEDNTIGTVDLPAIWNQRARVGLWLHWDGNNNAIRERNYAAAMAVGATAKSVIPANFQRTTDFVLGLQPPRFPFPIDAEKAKRGQQIFAQQCASCHAFGAKNIGQVTSIEAIGTDRHRLDSFTQALVTRFHSVNEPPFVFDAYRKTHGYSNLPIDGIWMRGPYLHNGSVPTLWDLLQPPDKRPKKYSIGYRVLDPVKVGFVSDGPEAKRVGFLLDTSIPGNGNGGHTYGVNLDDEQKWALIEYLKTL